MQALLIFFAFFMRLIYICTCLLLLFSESAIESEYNLKQSTNILLA
jgi:hypothetical protein